MKLSPKSTSWFTLVELLIAMTLFGMMSIMMLMIYVWTTDTTRRLNAQRELAGTAREIIERISEDVQQKWFSGETAFDTTTLHIPWTKYDYMGSGSEYLNLGADTYVYGKKIATGIVPCIDTPTENRKTDPKIHCGLYMIEDDPTDGYNLVDSSNPDESRKRVKITDLRFYVSGDGVWTARKVMMSFTLALIPGRGISSNLSSTTELHIQTTISERGWRQYN